RRGGPRAGLDEEGRIDESRHGHGALRGSLMLERRPDKVYWAMGIGSVVVHAAAVVFVLAGGGLRDRELSAQPVELVTLPSGVLDPLAPILPEPVPETAEPPPQEAPPQAAQEPEPPPAPKPEPDTMEEPNKVKNVKTPRPKPTTAPRPSPKP